MSQTDLLEEIDSINLIPAEKGARFLNYIIDIVGYYLFIFLFMMLIGILNPDFFRQTGDSADASLSAYVIALLSFLVYYTILEGATKGKTLGKLITNTRAVKEDGADITWSDAFKRTLSRIVPFEPFSGFSDRPWHDKWTNTIVVKKVKR